MIDEVGLLNSGQVNSLSDQIRKYLPRVQMQVWIIRSLEGEALEALSIRAVEQWKLGSEKNDNGLLLLVAVEDRAVRIEVGQGLEGDIPDAFAGRVIDYVLVPSFRNRDFFEGLSQALSILDEKVQSPEESEKSLSQFSAQSKNLSFNWFSFFWLFFVVVAFLRIFFFMIRKSLSGNSKFSSRHWGGWKGTSGGGWSGGGFGGGGWSGGGGGWSGGGGGFSGGGASGRW